jgi:hypothetical protein
MNKLFSVAKYICTAEIRIKTKIKVFGFVKPIDILKTSRFKE